MRSVMFRRLLALASAGVVVLAMSSMVPAAAAKPAPSAHHVTGAYIVEIGSLGLRAIHRLEVHTDALGRVQFGYYEQETMASNLPAFPPNRTGATVEAVRFFTLLSGAPAAEFEGQECALDGAAIGQCAWYHIIVSDGGPIGQPDTFCGAQDPNECYDWTVGSGNIAIF